MTEQGQGDYTRMASAEVSALLRLLYAHEMSGDDLWSVIEKESAWSDNCLKTLKAVAEQADIVRYLKRCIYLTDPELARQSFETVSDEDYRKSLYKCFKRPDNSAFTSNKAQYVGDWLSGNRIGRGRVILLGLVLGIQPDAVNHILSAKLGEPGLSLREPDEAIAAYAMHNQRGYNGYADLKEDFAELQKRYTPAQKLRVLRNGGLPVYTSFVSSHLGPYMEAGPDAFLLQLISQPLTIYAAELKEVLTGGLTPEWEAALNSVSPRFLRDMPGPRGRALTKVQKKHIEKMFPGYGLLSKTGLFVYEDLLEIIERENAKIKLARKPYEDMTTDEKGYTNKTHPGTVQLNAKKVADEIESYKQVSFHSEELYASSPYAAFFDYKFDSTNKSKGYLLRGTFPNWAKGHFKTTLNRNHKIKILKREAAVCSNDLVFLQLWLSELEMQKEDPEMPFESRERARQAFCTRVNSMLTYCGMEGLNPTNPFHFLALVSFVSYTPFEFFTEMVRIITGSS